MDFELLTYLLHRPVFFSLTLSGKSSPPFSQRGSWEDPKGNLAKHRLDNA